MRQQVQATEERDVCPGRVYLPLDDVFDPRRNGIQVLDQDLLGCLSQLHICQQAERHQRRHDQRNNRKQEFGLQTQRTCPDLRTV